MAYVDGFLLPVPTKNLKAYKAMSRKAGKLWREHGALDYKECVGDDLKHGGLSSFLSAVKLKKGESLVFAFIVFKSRRHRDSVNKKVMADPRLLPCHGKKLPFDLARMNYGGFKVFVDV